MNCRFVVSYPFSSMFSLMLNKSTAVHVLVGPLSPLRLSEERATVVASGYISSRPPILAIDGVLTTSEALCSSLTGTGTTWLRVNIQEARYIREVRLLFYEGSGAKASTLIGRSLRRNGSADSTLCGKVLSVVIGSHWQNFTCSLPVFGQYIYIETLASSMRLCEIQVFYGKKGM